MSDPIEEARALLAKATPGEWHGCPMRMFVFAANGNPIAELRGLGGGLPMDANHDLIVAAPRLLRALVEECERLRADKDGMQSVINGRMAECERLRAATPTDEEREAVGRLNMVAPNHPLEWSAVLCWLARAEAAQGGPRGE